MKRAGDIAVSIRGGVPAPYSAAKARAFTVAAAQRVFPGRDADVSLMFCGDAKMRRLNHDFRGKDATTDVLSFPMGDEEDGRLQAGDIVISSPRARLDARRDGMTLDAKMRQLILHSLLHLAGFDHETDADARRMDARARAILKQLP